MPHFFFEKTTILHADDKSTSLPTLSLYYCLSQSTRLSKAELSIFGTQHQSWYKRGS